MCCCTMVDMTCDEMLNLERSTAVGMRPSTAASTVQKAVQTCAQSINTLKRRRWMQVRIESNRR